VRAWNRVAALVRLHDINSPDFSTCLLLIQLVWVAVDITSYHSLNRVDMKSRNHLGSVLWSPSSPDPYALRIASRPFVRLSVSHKA